MNNNCLDLNMDKTVKIVIFLGILLIGSLIFSGSVSAASTGNTPQPKFHHDNNNTGQSEYTGPQTNATKWKYSTSNYIVSSAAIGRDGTIYIGSEDKNLYAISPSGKQKWKYSTGNCTVSSPAIGSDGTIYIGSFDHKLYAINPNGTLKWKYATNDLITSSPAIGKDGTIYIGSEDKNLYAIKPNGALKWKYTTKDKIGSSPAIGSDGTIYISSEDKNLYAIKPNGTLKWKYTTKDKIDSSPAIGKDGTIYIGSNDHNLYAIKPNGTLKWKYITGNIINSSPAVGTDGAIYVGSEDKNLYAIKPNGTLKWKYKTGNSIYMSSPAIGSDGTIYIGSEDKNLYAISPNGKQKWKYNTGNMVLSSAVIGPEKTLYIGSADNNLYAIEDINVSSSIPGGYYNVSKVITLKTNLPVTIYYKIYNSKNITNWLTYKSPLTIKNSCKLSFYTVSNNGNSSPIKTETYIIDKTAPKITVTKPSKNTSKASTTTPITVKFSENIYKSSNLSKICLKNMKTGKLVKISTSIKNNTLTIKNSKLTKNTNYQLYIPKSSVKDQAGNQLNQTYTLKFKTIR